MIPPTYFTHATQPLSIRARLSPLTPFASYFHYEGALSVQQLKEEGTKGEGEENNNKSPSSLSKPSSFPGLVDLSMDEKEREGLPSGSSSSLSLGLHQDFARNSSSSSSPGNIDNNYSNCPPSRQQLGTLEATTTTNQNEKDEDATSFTYALQHSKLCPTDADELHICQSLASSSLTKTLPPSSTGPVPADPSTSQLSPLTEYTGSSPFAFSFSTSSPSSELPSPLRSSSSSDNENDGIEKVLGVPILSADQLNEEFNCPSVPPLLVCPAVSTSSSSPSLASSLPVLETAMAKTNSTFAPSLTEANENESNCVWTKGRRSKDQSSAIWVDKGSTTPSSKVGVVSIQTRKDFSPTKTENSLVSNNADHLELEKQKQKEKKQGNLQVSELHHRQWKERSLQLFEAAWVEALRRERSAIWSSKKINFRVEFDTLFGQNVFLVGSSVFLGEWDLRSAVKMTWTRGNWWTVMVNVPRDHIAEAARKNDSSSVKYKYVVIDSDVHQVEWEPGNDHQFNLQTIKCGTVITDCWGLG